MYDIVGNTKLPCLGLHIVGNKKLPCLGLHVVGTFDDIVGNKFYHVLGYNYHVLGHMSWEQIMISWGTQLSCLGVHVVDTYRGCSCLHRGYIS